MRKVTYTAYNDEYDTTSEGYTSYEKALAYQPNPYYIKTVLTDCYEKTSEGAILSLLQRL